MSRSRVSLSIAALVASVFCVAAAVRPAQALEVIQLRTGQVAGVPGPCGGLDDRFHYNAVSMPVCPSPFRNAPFSPGDFASAAAGPKALVINAHPVWLTTLPNDPLARWINWSNLQGNCLGLASPVLYAAPFTVTSTGGTCPLTATVEICYAIDDWLGDPSGPNPIGIYLNGTGLDAGFSGGGNSQQFCYTQFNVPVQSGQNWLYAYQRDLGCGVSGLILSAKITVDAPPCPRLVAFKFNDLNGDGIQQMNEPPLAGWTFNLSGQDERAAISDGNGLADFGCVLPGMYVLSEVTQPGWVVTAPPGGRQVLNITCGQDYAVTFANHQCDSGQSSCIFPPKCLAAEWQFNECGGTTANEPLANRDGTLTGSAIPTWIAGRPGSSCGLRWSAALPGRVEVPDAPELDFGFKSFTISAWVRTTSLDAARGVVDKRVVISGIVTGYFLYLYGNQVYFVYNDGVGDVTIHASTSPGVADGSWHHLAVSVCRDLSDQGSNVARLVVDGHVDTFTGSSIPTLSLSNSSNLVIGDECPGFFTGVPFDGDIDDVLLFKCCLSVPEILALGGPSEYCTEMCYLPSILSTTNPSVQTTLTVCNYAGAPQTYNWSAAPISSGTCNRTGPPVFLPASGTVTVPAASNGPSCVNVPITIQLPGGTNWLDTACYQVNVINADTGRCCSATGQVRRSSPIWADPNPTLIAVPVDTPTPIEFTVSNYGDQPLSLSYTVATHSGDGDDGNGALRLNGLPPGIPVKGEMSLVANGSSTISVYAVLDQFQPLNINEVVFSADLGDGQSDALAVVSIESRPEGMGTTSIPDVPTQEVTIRRTATLTVLPNPFRGATSLHLVLPGFDPSIEVEIFDAGGREVRKVHSGPLEAGEHLLSWDARDDRGRLTPNGLYFVRVSGRATALERKVIRLE